MEAMSPEPKRNDRKDEDSHKSETSISEHSDERHSRNSPQNFQSTNTSDEV